MRDGRPVGKPIDRGVNRPVHKRRDDRRAVASDGRRGTKAQNGGIERINEPNRHSRRGKPRNTRNTRKGISPYGKAGIHGIIGKDPSIEKSESRSITLQAFAWSACDHAFFPFFRVFGVFRG